LDPDLISIGELSRRDYLKVSKSYTLEELIKTLLKEGDDRALIFDGRRLEGIVTIKDILSEVASNRRRRIPLTTLHASSVMSSPVIMLPQTASVLKAARVMIDKDISSVAVGNKEGEIGLFTKWEIAEILRNDETPIRTMIRAPPKVLKETDSLIRARKVILKDNPVVPVVSSEGRFIGILTPEVVLKALAELVDLLSEYGAKDSLSKVTVGEILRPLIPLINPSQSVGEAASLMIDKRVKAVLVFDGEGLIGCVTLTDLTNYLMLT